MDIKTNTARTRPRLQRRIGLTLLILYGLGTTVGGGIYVLVGHVAGRAGMFAPVSFLVAAGMVVFTAFSFAELSSRYPKSAGEAVYVQEGFKWPTLAVFVGLVVVANGIISSAALANGFAGYFRVILPLPTWLVVMGIILIIGLLAIWGIGEAVSVAAAITLIEIGGLLLIIWSGGEALLDLPARMPELLPPLEAASWAGIFSGSFLAFYAFIGFEDMVNVAEETKNPRHTLPVSIIITLALTALLYVVVALVSVMVIEPGNLAGSEAPLALIYETAGGGNSKIITYIGIIAVLNGALIQIIMAARVLYGMGNQSWLPDFLGTVNERTHTPINATILVILCVIALGLGFDIAFLAELTSFGILLVAAMVNGALFKMKISNLPADGGFQVPILVPAAGTVVSATFAIFIAHDILKNYIAGM